MMELQRVICLSTAHVTQFDTDRLAEDAGDPRFSQNPVFAANHTYGAFVYIPQTEKGVEELVDSATKYGYSASFARLLRYGAANQARYIHLDCDGPTDESAPLDIHDW